MNYLQSFTERCDDALDAYVRCGSAYPQEDIDAFRKITHGWCEHWHVRIKTDARHEHAKKFEKDETFLKARAEAGSVRDSLSHSEQQLIACIQSKGLSELPQPEVQKDRFDNHKAVNPLKKQKPQLTLSEYDMVGMWVKQSPQIAMTS